MKKVMLFLGLGLFSLGISSFKANPLSLDPEPYDPCVDTYVSTWLTVYLDTLDYDAADAAAWDAEDACEDVVTAGEWLNNQ
jgi:hypothetical protein